MNGLELSVFLIGAFVGGFASGLAGFAMGFIVSAVWLHLLTPLQTAALITGYSLWTQGYGVWKLRSAFRWKIIAPFILGGTIGVPIGTALLVFMDSSYLRSGVGALLVMYGAYGLTQPRLKLPTSGRISDSLVGFFNGVLCGLTGLPGFIITIWCQLRDWPKDLQRSVFQPVMLSASILTAVSLALTNRITSDILTLYLLGLPALLVGLGIGFALYGKLDDLSFRKTVLVLLLLAGFILIVPIMN